MCNEFVIECFFSLSLDDEIQGSTACRLTFKRRDLFPKHEQRYQSPQLPTIPTNAFDDNNFPDVLTPENYHEYKDWISERKALRNSLDSMGLSKSWLCGKERNPLEGKALRSLLQAEKKKQGDTDMLRQLVRCGVAVIQQGTYVRTYVVPSPMVYVMYMCMYPWYIRSTYIYV